jgi:hypothetical protein
MARLRTSPSPRPARPKADPTPKGFPIGGRGTSKHVKGASAPTRIRADVKSALRPPAKPNPSFEKARQSDPGYQASRNRQAGKPGVAPLAGSARGSHPTAPAPKPKPAPKAKSPNVRTGSRPFRAVSNPTAKARATGGRVSTKRATAATTNPDRIVGSARLDPTQVQDIRGGGLGPLRKRGAFKGNQRVERPAARHAALTSRQLENMSTSSLDDRPKQLAGAQSRAKVTKAKKGYGRASSRPRKKKA